MASLESSGFVLAVRGRSLELDGSVTVGRSTACDVVLHRDEEASRVHARFFVDESIPFVQDLGSTNGTFVGGERITERRRLNVGDVVRIGSSLVTLGVAEPAVRSHAKMAELAALDLRPSPSSSDSTRPAEVFEVLDRVVGNASERGHVREAERAAAMHLEKLLGEARQGTACPQSIDHAVRIAAQLARSLPSARWLDYLVELHAVLDRPLNAELVELVCASSEVTRISPARLREYCRRLADRSSSLSIPERMGALRLQGILPLIHSA